MKKHTAKNVKVAFVEEGKATVRLLSFVERAESEGLLQITSLFSAVAAAEGIYAKRHFALLNDSIENTE